jgi:hypothetical protein
MGVHRTLSGSSHCEGAAAHAEDGEGDLRGWRPGTRDPDRPVSCLTQLYSQAAFAAPLLRAGCKRWASAAGPAAEVFRPGEATEGGPVELYGFEWLLREGLLKDPARAAEKALVCYDGDVSRVLDICRARLVCEDVGCVAACLEAMRNDASVRLLHVKNFMSGGPALHHTGGFRVRGAHHSQFGGFRCVRCCGLPFYHTCGFSASGSHRSIYPSQQGVGPVGRGACQCIALGWGAWELIFFSVWIGGVLLGNSLYKKIWLR